MIVNQSQSEIEDDFEENSSGKFKNSINNNKIQNVWFVILILTYIFQNNMSEETYELRFESEGLHIIPVGRSIQYKK